MAHSNQARKRARQNDKARLRNKAKLSSLKTTMKTVMAAVQSGDKTKAAALAVKACQVIDKAAQSHVIHAHKASRHKGQVMRAVGAMK